MKKLAFFLFLFPLISMAQLTTSTSQGASQLVENVLLGQGVDVSNITYQGAGQAIGYFNGENTTLGFKDGILITTGTVNNVADGPHGPNKKGNATVNNGAGGYNMLSQLVGGTATYNAAVLQFDFIPYADTIKFRYIFGSEEYREYVNTGFNDVFAFFISGPGYSGYQNIALLPNGTPVTIDNINDGEIVNGAYSANCKNCQYFVYNGDGSESPYDSQSKYIQYDGFTKPLEAIAKVQCGKKYHLIIAIADVKDDKYDSGIFLEANSLSSNIEARVDYVLSNDIYNDGVTMTEGCSSTTLKVSRPANKAIQAITIPITVSGTATMGVDYNNIPSSITLNPGETEKTFTISPVLDYITEGTETIDLIFGIPDACGNINEKKINLKIADTDTLSVSITGQDKLCPSQDVVLTAHPVGGTNPYNYVWSNGETGQSITVSPDSDFTYSVTVKEGCVQQTATDTFRVHVVPYTEMTLFPSDDIFEPCRNMPTDLSIKYINGAPNYDITWTDSKNKIVGNTDTITVSPWETTTYTVTIKDGCGFEKDTSILYTITTPPLVVEPIAGLESCPRIPVNVNAHASGGYGTIEYHWSNGVEGPTNILASNSSKTYTVTVTDDCNTYSEEASVRLTIIRPHAEFLITNYPLTQGVTVGFENTSTNGDYYDWNFGDTLSLDNNSTLKNPTHIYEETGGYIVRLIAISDLGCSDTTYQAIEVMPEMYIYVPNAFTPNGDRHNQTFQVSTINVLDFYIRIYNRWGELIFESHDKHFQWDGTYKGMMVTDDVYAWVIDYLPIIGGEERISGHITVIR